MTKTRKLIAAILVLVMALTVTQATAFAGSSDKDITTMASCDIAASGDTDGDGTGGEGGSGNATDPTGSSGDVDDPSTSESTEPSSTESTEPSSGESTEPSSTNPTKTTQPTTKPKPVVPKVTVKKSGPALLVSWTAFTGANYYEVYRSYKKGSRGPHCPNGIIRIRLSSRVSALTTPCAPTRKPAATAAIPSPYRTSSTECTSKRDTALTPEEDGIRAARGANIRKRSS